MKKIILRIIFCLSILTGLSLILYPSISNYINEINNKSVISDYNKSIKTYSAELINNIYLEAQEYNHNLSEKYTSDNSKVLKPYNEILDFGDGLIGYIEIPSIKIYLPIYHGESEDVLRKGAAHLENTSFPIGGKDTHTVLSAHSGFPSQKFFDDIDKLENGDLIYIHTLNTTLTYSVLNSEIVNPNDTSQLEIVFGKDLLTLVTCYPYGVNSHRLLIHAEHINNSKNSTPDTEAIKSVSNNNHFWFYLIITILLGIFIFVTIRHFTNRKADGNGTTDFK